MKLSRRSLVCSVVLLALGMTLSSCILKPGRGLDKGRKFESPFSTPVQLSSPTLQGISEVLAARNPRVHTVRAAFGLVTGGGVRGKQTLNTVMYTESPRFLRLRGSQNEGTIFDVLVNRGTVQIVMYPERRFYRGTLDQLAANPGILAGVYPEDLMDNFSVEQTIVDRIRENPAAQMQETRDHYVIEFPYSNGMSEHYYLRKQDLLTDLYERTFNGKPFSSIKYWGYKPVAGNYLFPSQFTIRLPQSGGELAAHVTEVDVDQQPAPELYKLTAPDGFDHMAL